MIKKISSIVPLAFLSLLLGSCGGGNPFVDDTPSGAPTLSAEGQAIDGYLNNAKVCLDVDEDGACGASEPQSRTDAEGKYKFEAEKAKLDAFRVVVAVVPGETVDMDEPDAVITESYTLTAPPGKYGVVANHHTCCSQNS